MQKQTAVVLLNSNSKTFQRSGGVSVATLCVDALPASKHSKQRDWLSLLQPPSVNIKPNSSLRFSASLNDVGQRMDSLCRGLHFIDRTCSEGELELKPEHAPLPDSDRRAQTLNSKMVASRNQAFSTRNQPHLVPAFGNNYKYTLGTSPSTCLPFESAVIHPLPTPHQPNTNFLRILLPFSRSPTSVSLQCSEMGSYASHLQITKSSSTLLEGSEQGCTPESLMGDDVFEVDQSSLAPKTVGPQVTTGKAAAPGTGSFLAPLCYMDEDSDLDGCQTPLSDKTGPLSPYSLSGDCCRWVTVWSVIPHLSCESVKLSHSSEPQRPVE
ncbi:uncharacterized protein LOC114476832 [Gouania willdenowi]|uniref:uncharacterized protein LOC114476832 n=1 Tax=Gouania willdenowi TaxID=441366 RepID=UPI001054B6F3|nr:uncharacterized protein LOC114476832 [Gouania willdenowi]